MVEVYHKTICAKLFSNQASGVLTRRFLKFFLLVAMANLYKKNLIENHQGLFNPVVYEEMSFKANCLLTDFG